MSILTQPQTLAPAIPPFPLRRFTVEEYHKLARTGVLPSGAPFELLEGWIVPKMTRHPPHDTTLDKTQEALRDRLSRAWRLRIQSAITTTDSEPEPDIAVVPGPADRYNNRHPGPSDIALLVEVADSSLLEDRNDKGRIYARAGIAVYWIVNVQQRQVEVYTDPSGPISEPLYGQRRDYREDELVPLVIAGQEIAQVPVRDLLAALPEK